DHLQPGDVRQSEVEHDDVVRPVGQRGEALRPGLGLGDRVAARGQVHGERPQQWPLVLDDQHTGHDHDTATAGLGDAARNSITTAAPPPGVSSARTVPPIASVRPRAIARPSPTPLPSPRASSLRWNGWNTASSASLGMPGPRSMTRSSTASPYALPDSRT